MCNELTDLEPQRRREREAFEAMREALRNALGDPEMVAATWKQIRAALALADKVNYER